MICQFWISLVHSPLVNVSIFSIRESYIDYQEENLQFDITATFGRNLQSIFFHILSFFVDEKHNLIHVRGFLK